jgi:hypothetical protein
MALQGVYQAKKKDGTIYYRSSLTYKSKHISLGSFPTDTDAHNCYLEGLLILNGTTSVHDYSSKSFSYISFEKYITLVNFRDNGMYFKNPIYLYSKYFKYYYDENTEFTFDVDDLFFYSTHKIMKRNGHIFVADYGMQLNILSRYGIKNYSVAGKDYLFVNGDETDFRYKNIQIINRYNGVSVSNEKGYSIYTVKIHINGDYIVGRYRDETEAAIAYNKAGDLLVEKGILKRYQKNYLEHLSPIEYAKKYTNIKISDKIRNMSPL